MNDTLEPEVLPASTDVSTLAAAKAAKAPDKEKLAAWMASFKALSLPEMATTEGKDAMASIKTALNRVYLEIKATVESM